MSAYGPGPRPGNDVPSPPPVARGRTVEVVAAPGDADRVTTPALAYAARGVFATGVQARRRTIGSPDRVAPRRARQPPPAGSGGHPGRPLPPDAVLGAMVHNVVAAVAAGKGEPPGRAHRGPPDPLVARADRRTDRCGGVGGPGSGGLQLIPNAVAVAVAVAVDHAIGDPLAEDDAIAVVDIGAAGAGPADRARRDRR